MRWSLSFERNKDGSGWKLSVDREDAPDPWGDALRSCVLLVRELLAAQVQRDTPRPPPSRVGAPN